MHTMLVKGHSHALVALIQLVQATDNSDVSDQF